MKLKPFIYHHPVTIQEALQLASAYPPGEYLFIGGGTDVLVRMRLLLLQPRAIIDLRSIQDLIGLEVNDEYLSIGAATTLKEVARFHLVRCHLATLSKACGQIATPQIRNMGTIGGNICLETRCSYYNQMAWAGGFKPCFKRGGRLCHVVRSGLRCYALFSADTPPSLMVLKANLCLVGPKGEREISINDFYHDDGVNTLNLESDEIITQIKVPLRKGVKSSYRRINARQAIDFPELGVAVAVDLVNGGVVQEVCIATTGLLSKPVRLKTIEDMLIETELREDLLRELELDFKELKIFPHHGVPPWYKKQMLKVLIKQAMLDILTESKG